MCPPAQVESWIGMDSASDPDRPPRRWDILRQALHHGLQSIDRRLEAYGPLEPDHFRLQEANPRWAHQAREVPRRKFRVEVIGLDEDGVEQRSEVLEMEPRQLAMESLGMSLADGKAILQGGARVCDGSAGKRRSAAPAELPERR
jgi:hypothetical protein